MKKKGANRVSTPKTARFSPEEEAKIYQYLRKNPVFENFSALVRVATLSFIEKETHLGLNPISADSHKNPSDQAVSSDQRSRPDEGSSENRLYFLADQNMTESQIRHILKNGSEIEQVSITSLLISEAQWNDIWNYTTPEDLIRLFPKLWFWQDSKRIVWQRILEEWKETGELICPQELQNEIKSGV